MYKPSPYFPDEPFTSSPVFVAWLDLTCDGFPQPEKLTLAQLFECHARMGHARATKERRLAANREGK